MVLASGIGILVCLFSMTVAVYKFEEEGILGAIEVYSQKKCFGPNTESPPRVILTDDCNRLYRFHPNGTVMDVATQQCLETGPAVGWDLQYKDCSDIQYGFYTSTVRYESHFSHRYVHGDETPNHKCAQAINDVIHMAGYPTQQCHNVDNQVYYVAPGMTWFDTRNDITIYSVDTKAKWSADAISNAMFAEHCNSLGGRRLCTAAEICPNGPNEQSMIGDGHKGNYKYVHHIPVLGKRTVLAQTCVMKGPVNGASGIMCCKGDLPKPKIYVEEGVGYLIHRSGKCVHVINGRTALKDSCDGQTSALRWTANGQIRLLEDGTCLIVESEDEGASLVSGQCTNEARLQFTEDRTLQDLVTARCLAPQGSTDADRLSPPVDTELVEVNNCTSEASFFLFQALKGAIKHSSDQCLAIINDALALQTDCDDGQQVFYKSKNESRLQHLVSGKCLHYDAAGVLSVGSCATPSDSIPQTDNCFIHESGKLKTCAGSQCIIISGSDLSLSTSCNTAASTFHFLDIASECIGADCTCAEGYARRGTRCIPVDNCKKADHGGCVGNAICHYIGPGENACLCPPGSKLDESGTTCRECSDKNCYAGCDFYSDDELKDALSDQDKVILRFSHLKSSHLQAYLTDTTEYREVVVYTQAFAISGTLDIPWNTRIAVFANQIVQESGSITLLSNGMDGRDTVRRSVVIFKNKVLVCSNKDTFNKHYIEENAIQGASIMIYQGRTGLPFTCTSNYNVKTFVQQEAISMKTNRSFVFDVQFLTLGVACAKVLAQDEILLTFENEKSLLFGSPPMQILKYVLAQVDAGQTAELSKDTKTSLSTLGLKAQDLMDIIIARSKGMQFVPYLSLYAYEKLLTLLKEDAKLAIDQYERYRKRSIELADKIDATISMTHTMTAIVKENDRNIEAMKRELDTAIEDQKLMERKFEEAKADLEVKREAFEAGVKEYQIKMMMNAIFSCLGAITSVFSGIGGTLGALGDIASLPGEMSALSKSLQKIGTIMDTIAGIVAAADSFKELKFNQLPYAQSGANDYYSQELPTSSAGKSLAVSVAEWDVFVANARGSLAIGTATEISGTGPYLAALEVLAVWGQGTHQLAIVIQQLMNKLISMEDLQRDQAESQKNIEQQIAESEKADKINNELVVEMALQKERLRFILVDTLLAFCDCYEYNWMYDCPVKPTLSDDLYGLHSKVNQGLSSVVKIVDNFAPFIAQNFEIEKVIDDHICDARSSTSSQPVTQCTPIAEVQSGREFVYRIYKDDPHIMKGYERVRIEEMEVYLEGAQVQAGEPITILIFFSGYMTDIFKGREHKFVAPSRVTVFSYIQGEQGAPQKVIEPGKVAQQFQQYYDGIAALTTWSFRVPSDENHPSLDLSGVSQVKLILKGTRVHKEVHLFMAPQADQKKVQSKPAHKKAKSPKRKYGVALRPLRYKARANTKSPPLVAKKRVP